MINLFQFIIGTILGSFVTLSSIRSVRHESVIFPPSHCDYCHHRLHPWELIPVLSFLLLKGRCHRCHQLIKPLTFIGELTGGLIVLKSPLTTTGIIEIIFELTLLFIAECDYNQLLIPSWSLILLFVVTMISLIYTQQLNTLSLIITGLAYLGLSLLNHYHPFIGNGDIDLLFILLLKTNLMTLLMIITLSSLLAIIKYIINHRTKLIPYGPYLAFVYFLIQGIKK